MKERLVNFSYLAAGHIVQDIVILDDSISGEEMVRMLNSGEAFTTVHEDNDVITPDGTVIGKVRWSDTELEYSDFQIEAGEYEEEQNEPQFFDASNLALRGAVEEFVYEPEMSVDDIMKKLTATGNRPSSHSGLQMEQAWETRAANVVLNEIDLFAKGLRSLMYAAHKAALDGKEFI